MTRNITSIPNPNLTEFELSMAMRGKSWDKFIDSASNKDASSLIGIIPKNREINLYTYYLRETSKAASIISCGIYPITSIITSTECNDDNLNLLFNSCRNSCKLIIIFRTLVLVVNNPTCETCEDWETVSDRLKRLYNKVWNSQLLRKIFNYILTKLIFKFGTILIDLIIS